MATVNRYTRNVSRARYNPRSMQEMLMLPMMQRKRHDQATAKASEMAMFDNQAAGVDRPFLDQKKGEYEDSINSYVEELNKDGVNSNTTQGLINLSKNRRELESKYLNPAQSNLQAMQALKKELMEVEGWSPQHAQAYAAKQIQQFGGTFNEDGSTNSFSGRMLPKHVDANKRLDEAIDKVGETVVQGGLEQYGVHSYYDLLASTKVSQKEKERIIQAVGSELSHDPTFLNSYKVESELNGLQEFDSQGNLKIGQFTEEGRFAPESNLGMMLASKAHGASAPKTTQTFKTLKDDMRLEDARKLLEQEEKPGNAYTSLPVQRREMSEKVFINKLKAKPKPLKEGSNTGGIMGMSVGVGSTYGKDVDHYSLNEQETERYKNIASKMRDSGLLSKEVDLESTEARQAVGEYLEQYSDQPFDNKLIRSHQVKPKTLEEGLLYHTDAKKAGESLGVDIRNGLVQVWDEEGNAVEVDDLELEDNQLDYLGIVSPSNHIPSFKQGGERQTVSPHMVGIDNKRYYVGRQDSDFNTPGFMAASTVKKATYEGGALPKLWVDHEVENTPLRSEGITGMKTKYNPSTQSYTLQINFEDGTSYTPPEGELNPERFSYVIEKLFDGKDL